MAGISKKKIKTKTGEKVKYTITYTDIFGKRHTSGYYETIKEAKRDLWKFDEVKTDKNITFGQIFKLFLDKAKLKYALSTYDTYNIYYNKYLKQLDGIKYDSVNSIAIQGFFYDLEKNSTPHVAMHCLKLARASTNYAIKHKLIEKNIFNEVEKPKPPKADINHLTIEELKNVLEMCKKCYREYYPLLFTFIGTGAREGEILALETTDFNYEQGYIEITKQFTQARLVYKTKTESSNRKIFLFDELKEVLKEHIKTLKPDNPLLFPSKAGTYLRGENFRKRCFYKILKLCGINKRVRLHDLRGSYIDMVLSSGLSVKFAQNQVGHARTETTLNVYAQNNSDMITAATSQLNTYFKKNQQKISKIKNEGNNKIIPFRKKQSGIIF